MKYNSLFIHILLFSFFSFSQEKIALQGSIFDTDNYEVPYAAIGIVKKHIGTSSTDEGTFYFVITEEELEDTLQISCIGYKTFKIKVKDFITRENKRIIIEQKITELSDVYVLTPNDYVKLAIKSLKQNTISSNHQLKMLYRRWSVEDNICRFYIEHYINAIDRGPSSYMVDFAIEQSRTSSEYRFVKNEQKIHALRYMEMNNPLRKGLPIRSYKWKKVGDSSYDGEDIIIVEGTTNKVDFVRLFIGFDTYSIYKIEMYKDPQIGKSLEATYIYKKNDKGKLYLSYHNREWKGSSKLTERIKQIMQNNGQYVPNYIPIAYRHEVFVLEVQEDKKKFDMAGVQGDMDMTLFKVPFDTDFWKNISLPPETTFFKKNIKELESLYDVPIETQFKYSNN